MLAASLLAACASPAPPDRAARAQSDDAREDAAPRPPISWPWSEGARAARGTNGGGDERGDGRAA